MKSLKELSEARESILDFFKWRHPEIMFPFHMEGYFFNNN